MSVDYLRHEIEASLKRSEQLLLLDRMRRHMYVDDPSIQPEKETGKSKFGGTFNTVRLKKYFGLGGTKKKEKVPLYQDLGYYGVYPNTHRQMEMLGNVPRRSGYPEPMVPTQHYPEAWMYTTVTSKTVHTVYTSMRMAPGGVYRARPSVYGWDGYAPPPPPPVPFDEGPMRDESGKSRCICGDGGSHPPPMTWSRKQKSIQCTCDGMDDMCNGIRKASISNEDKKEVEAANNRKDTKKKTRKKNLLGGNFRTVSGASASAPQRKSILECNITAYDLITKNNGIQKKGKQKGGSTNGHDSDETLVGNGWEKEENQKSEKKGISLKMTKAPAPPTTTQPQKTVEEEWDDYTDPMEVRICGQKIRVGETFKNGTYEPAINARSPSPRRIESSTVRLSSKPKEPVGQSSLAKATSDQMNLNQSINRNAPWRSPDKSSSRNTLVFNHTNVIPNRANGTISDSSRQFSDSNITSGRSSEVNGDPSVSIGKDLNHSRSLFNGTIASKNGTEVLPSNSPQTNHSNGILRNGSAVVIKINSNHNSSVSKVHVNNSNNNSYEYPQSKESKSFPNISTDEPRCLPIPRVQPRIEPSKTKAMNGRSTVTISRDILYEEDEDRERKVTRRTDKEKNYSLCHSQSTPNIAAALQPFEKSITTAGTSTEFNVKPILKKPSSLDTSSETDSDLYASEWNDSKRKKKRVHFKSSSESNLLELSEVIAVEADDIVDDEEDTVTTATANGKYMNGSIDSNRVGIWSEERISDRDDDDYLTPLSKNGPSEPIYVNQPAFDSAKDSEYDDCISLKGSKSNSLGVSGDANRITQGSSSVMAGEPVRPVNLRRSHSARELSPVANDNEGRTRSPPARSNSFQQQAPRSPDRSRRLPHDDSNDFSADRSDSEATIVAGDESHQEASRHLDWLIREKGSSTNILPKSIKDILRSEETLYDDTGPLEEDSSGFGSRTSSVMGESSTFQTVRDSLRRKNGVRASGGPCWSPKAGRSAPQHLQTGSVDRYPRKKTTAERTPVRNHSWDRGSRPNGVDSNNANKRPNNFTEGLPSWNHREDDAEQERHLGKENLPGENENESDSPKSSSPSSECNYKSNFEFIINLRNKKFSIPRPPLIKPKGSPVQRHGFVAPLVANKESETTAVNPEEETMTVSIYEQISEPIYEELPDYPENQTALALVPPPLPTGPLGGGGQPRRSIFEGASRNEILSILEDAKERGVENMEVAAMVPTDMEDRTEDSEPQVIPAQRNHRIRVSNISNLSDSSHSSDDSNNTEESKDSKERRGSAEVERNDSGVGPETSKPARLRRQISLGQSNDESICEDCEQPIENKGSGMLFEPLVCKKCSKKRAERRETIAEIVETEFKYGRDLKIIRDEFSRPMAVAGLLTSEQLTSIFLNIDELIGINTKFTEKLRDAIDIAVEQGDDDYMTVNIGKVFLESTAMLHSFESYCVRQGAACMLLTNLEKDKELLRIFLRVSQMENTLLRRMNLNSFLMVPVQRVTKYPLLLNRLYKVTPYHHKDREAIREAQQKIEFHLEHINQQAKDISGTKVWRRISHISSTYNKRVPTEQDIGNIKLRKMALEVLEWNSDEVRFVMEGRLQFTQLTDHIWNRKNKSFKLSPVYGLLVALGKPNTNYRPDLVESDSLMFPKNTGIREVTLLVAKEKAGRFTFVREPLHLQRCVICSDPESDEMFEIQDFVNKEGYLFKAEDTKGTQEWLKQLRYHAKDLGSWRRRRNALANIMINGMVRP